jgi:hypothetical protein
MSPVQARLRNLEFAFYNTQPTCQPNMGSIDVQNMRFHGVLSSVVFWIFEKQKEERPVSCLKRGDFLFTAIGVPACTACISRPKSS